MNCPWINKDYLSIYLHLNDQKIHRQNHPLQLNQTILLRNQNEKAESASWNKFQILYIHTMNTNTVLRFLGWASLTYMWLETNCMFFNAIADAIHQHNEQIGQKAIQDLQEAESDSEVESEDESELESEVVETTVTKTFFKILNIHNV